MSANPIPAPLPPVPAAAGSPVHRARAAVTEAERRQQEARSAVDAASAALVELERDLGAARNGDDLDRVSSLAEQRPGLAARVKELGEVARHRDLAVETARSSAERIEQAARAWGANVRHIERGRQADRDNAAALRQQAATIDLSLELGGQSLADARERLRELVGDLSDTGEV